MTWIVQRLKCLFLMTHTWDIRWKDLPVPDGTVYRRAHLVCVRCSKIGFPIGGA